MMLKKAKQTATAGDHSTIFQAEGDINLFIECNTTELIDQKIEEEIEIIRKSRFFIDFDRTKSSKNFGGHLQNGKFSGGSEKIRERGLAWCSRLLARTEEIEQAEEYLKVAKSLGESSETKIAEAFILSQKGQKSEALKTLAEIDSDASRSAGLMVVFHHDKSEGALKWMKDTGYNVQHLDSDGKSFLLSNQLQLSHWEDAKHTVEELSESDFDKTPHLHYLVALANLIIAIPTEFRTLALTQVPFDAANFQLASDEAAMDARHAAQKHFLNAVEAAKQLKCVHAARISDKYALWLELRDPDPMLATHGKKRLESKLRYSETMLEFIHFAVQFGVKLDLEKVDREIDHQIAINGGMTIDAAVARYAIALTKSTPADVANYIARHHNQLAAHIDPKLLHIRQIEMFSRAGLIDNANEILEQLIQQGITTEEEKVLQYIIEKSKGDNPVEPSKERYNETGKLNDLINLVIELDEHRYWDDLCKYGKILFEKTRSLEDAERLVKAFNETNRSKELVDFLIENPDLLPLSRNLQMSYAWGLFFEGNLLESRKKLTEINYESDNPNYRRLKVNIGITSGDWASLSGFIEDEYQSRKKRSADELIRTAQLAIELDSHRAKSLLFEAVDKAGSDADILASAYYSATLAGWDSDPQISKWIKKAAEISDDDGPIKKMSKKDLYDQKPEWDHQKTDTLQSFSQGSIPIFLAAQSLNRSVIDFTTFPAFANQDEPDPRRRNIVPAYSGKRVPMKCEVRGKTVALDATALLTLSFLNILDAVLDACNLVYIPHSTLGWLFEERHKATFHQPSRIKDAHHIRDLLVRNLLEKFNPTTKANSDLAIQVGEELAALIAEAEKVREDDKTQHIVIRPAPVYRISSLMEEEADLSEHASVLSSCHAVVDKLKQKGIITSEKANQARNYLKLHEKPWPNQPEITDGATLYLDDLAATYLLHLGLLELIKAAGLRVVVSPLEESEMNNLISYENYSKKVKNVIENLRTSLNLRIESGHVKIGRKRHFEVTDSKSILAHPTIGIIDLVPYCDSVIVDDRYINQYPTISMGDTKSPVFTTLDLLDTLKQAGDISEGDWLEHRTQIRQAGYLFVPVNEDELDLCLKRSVVKEGVVEESAELKAIRESILHARMGNWLQLPKEAPWLDHILKVFIHVLRNLWKDDADINQITAYSNWLVDQVDIRGWAHSLVPENADNIVRIGRGELLFMLLNPPSDVEQNIVDAYFNWAEEKLLTPLKDSFSDLYDWLIEKYREKIDHVVEINLSEGDDL